MTRNYTDPLRTVAVLVLPLAVMVASACNRAIGQTRSGSDPLPVVDVKLTVPAMVPVPQVIVLSGALAGNEQAKVAAGAAGKVIATYVERGQLVKKGAVLARLDARALRAQADEASAQIESLKAQRSLAESDCERTSRMFGKGAIAKSEYDRTRTQCETSKWSVSAAQARKALIAEALRDTEIRAPFSGMVVERNVAAGEYVRADATVATLVDVDSMRVELTVPEADVANVREGMPVEFRIVAREAGLYRGKVRYIGPSVREQTRDAVVEAVVENQDHGLRPGMFVTANLALGHRVLPALPRAALRSDGTRHHVFVEAGGRLEDRLVQVAEPQGDLVPVVEGVAGDDRVVAELLPAVRDGVRVK